MKAEVGKAVEVVLHMTEAEAKCLREIMRCVTVVDRTVKLNANIPEPQSLVDDMDSDVINAIDGGFYKAGIR